MANTKDLPPNPNNPRRVDDRRLTMLKKSLLEFGDLSGITFNKQSGQLVTGHQRVSVWNQKVAGTICYDKKYEKPTRSGTVALGKISVDGEEFAYREVQWPAHIEKAANIAANRNAGEFELSILSDAMADLRELDVDLDLTMFDVSEREKLFASEKFEEQPEPDSHLDEKQKISCPSCGEEFVPL